MCARPGNVRGCHFLGFPGMKGPGETVVTGTLQGAL